MILVTGATGMLGAHLLLHLLQKKLELPIRALYRTESKKEYVNNWILSKFPEANVSKISWYKADVTDIPMLTLAFKSISHIYHCAGFISFNPKDLSHLNKTNIEGTANMVNLALHFNVTKFVHVSSIATLGDPNINKMLDENSIWNPERYNGDYAISKNGGEIEVWRAINEGLNAVIVNPGVILGDGFWNSGSAELFNKINNGFSFYTKGTTGFVAVTDVVNCMIQLMESNIKNQRFILVESSKSYQSIFNIIADALGKKRPSLYANAFVTGLTWRILYLISTIFKISPTLTKDTALSAHSISTYDNSKIIETLSYNFLPIEEYIKDIANLYKKSSV